MWLMFSFLAAVFFGVRGILYQVMSQKPLDRNLMLFGVYLTGTMVTLAMTYAANHQWSYGNLLGILMGTFSFISNASMYRAFAVGKASLVAILTGLTPLVVVTGAYILFGEKLNLWQGLAFAVILLGIVLIRYSSDLSITDLKGVHWGLMTMVFFGLNDVSGKQAMLLNADVYPTLFVMFVTGTSLFSIVWLRGKRKALSMLPAAEDARVTWPDYKTLLVGMAVGITNVCGMIFILVAFRHGVTGLVSAVTALNVLIIILYARIFLKEKFTIAELAGMLLSFVGIILLRLMG